LKLYFFKAIDWKTERAELTCGNKSFEVFSSHYSLSCSVKGKLIAIDTIDKLRPLALITATERNSALAGGVYPNAIISHMSMYGKQLIYWQKYVSKSTIS
jgi:hypothetical protein